MTSILQRVCDTTESPEIYRLGEQGKRERVHFDVSMERGMHNIEDEIVFANHDGYIFHDSRGLESGSELELKIVQDFVRRRSRGRRLKDRLHAIWYCIPMDNDRPSLDLRYFGDVCPDKNVPVIAVFTKFDQFKLDIEMKLEDEGRDPETDLDAEVERVFEQHYLANLRGSPQFVRLERMNKPGQRCTELIEKTANALSGSVVALMLLAIQKDDLELNIRRAVKWAHAAFERGDGDTDAILKLCILAFPSIWYFERGNFDREFKNNAGPIYAKLKPYVDDPPLSILSDDVHHALIAITVILERACLFFWLTAYSNYT